MNPWRSPEERRQLLLAQCVLRDVPCALTKTMATALLQAGIELPADVRTRFPEIYSTPVETQPKTSPGAGAPGQLEKEAQL